MQMIIAHILSAIGSFFNILSDKDKSGKNILAFNAIANFFLGVHYLLLGAITGGITSFVAIPRNFLFYKYKNKIPFIVLIGYFAFLILCNFSSITSLLNFIPVSLVMIYTLGLYSQDKLILKSSILLTCYLEIIYDVHYGAYVCMSVCIINIILVSLSMNDIGKKRNISLIKE